MDVLLLLLLSLVPDHGPVGDITPEPDPPILVAMYNEYGGLFILRSRTQAGLQEVELRGGFSIWQAKGWIREDGNIYLEWYPRHSSGRPLYTNVYALDFFGDLTTIFDPSLDGGPGQRDWSYIYRRR